MQCAIRYRKRRYPQYVCHASLHRNLDIMQEPISQLTLDSKVPAGDQGEDGSLSVRRVKSVGLPANQPTDVDSSTQGESKAGEEDFLTNTATQPTPQQHSKSRYPPPTREKNATPKDPRDS